MFSAENFCNYLIEKGCSAFYSENYIECIMKQTGVKSVEFRLYIHPDERYTSLYLENERYRFLITVRIDGYLDVSNAKSIYLFSRFINSSLEENLYKTIRFLLNIDTTFLSEVQYLVCLNDKDDSSINKAGFPLVSIRIDDDIILDCYGQVMGYRISTLRRGFYNSFIRENYDVDIEVAGSILDKLLPTKRKYIVPIENVDGVYRNCKDDNNVIELTSRESLESLINNLSGEK